MTDPSQLTSAWTTKSLSIQNSANQAVAYSGNDTLIFRQNGTFFKSSVASSISVAGTDISKNCTAYSSGNWTLSNGSIALTSAYIGVISGSCDSNGAVSIVPVSDVSYSAILVNGQLNFTYPFTYKDSSGNSQNGSMVVTYTQGAAETWDGTGIDPRFTGSFTVKSFYANYICTNSQANNDQSASGTVGFSGTVTNVVTGTSYTYTENNYIVGTQPACTGTSQGTLSVKPLEVDPSDSSDSTACIEGIFSNAVPTGDVNLLNRDIATNSNQWVNFEDVKIPDSNCQGGMSETQTIMILGK